MHAEPKVDFNDRCLQAQEKLYYLKLKEARALIDLEKKSNPDNLIPSYLDVIHDLLKVLTEESSESFRNFHATASKSKSAIGRYTGKDGWDDFFREEIHFYTSVVYGKSGNAITAANEVRLSYKAGEKLIKEHPDFLPAYKTLGLIHAGFGNLPATYRKLVSMLGYSGTTDKGISELEKFTKASPQKGWSWMQQEAKLYLTAIHLYLKNDQETAWKMTETITKDYHHNPLMVFVRANFADKCKYNDDLITTILSVPKGDPYEPIPFLDFLIGTAKLQRLDADASVYLERFIRENKGSSYVKSCYQKLAWNALIKGDNTAYDSYMQKLKSHGSLFLEEDQQAEMEAERSGRPDARLLKSRLLFDGGYYTKALSIVRPLQAEDFDSKLLKTEYCYRKARIYDETKENDLAELFYKATIENGSDLTVYYASYAALYLGELYERTGKKTEARSYFTKATSFKNNKEYKNSVEHRAKAGLQRLSSK
ncbi:MAG: hypothetical protein GC181_09160 [Bacteroidetes bacterium]|nr:hypothetical protein [Bacteroidota bacterium]